MRIAVYSRQSTPNDVQVAEHVRWCVEKIERQGDTVVGPFTDDGISGFKRKVRPGYERLLATVAAGEVDAVMAVTYDRLLRDPREGVRFAETLEKAGVTDVLFVDEGDIDLTTADGRKLFRDRASAATHYSDRLSEKVRDSKRRIAYDGRWCGGAPYGYEPVPPPAGRRIGSGLAINEAEAEVIREALAAIKSGSNAHQVAVALRSRGAVTGYGKPWTSKALRRVLLSPAIAGIASLNGEELHDVAVQWDPIISKADHALLVERLAPGNVERRPAGTNLRHPLSGLLFCGGCGAHMYGASLKDGRARYTCSSERQGCGKVSVAAAYIEMDTVTHAITRMLTEKRQPVASGVSPEVQEAAAAELAAIAQDRAKLNSLSESDIFTPRELAPKYKALQVRERKARAMLKRPVAIGYDVRKVATEMKARWDAFNAGDRDAAELLHEELALIIERIDISPIPKGARRNVFNPERVSITWR